MLQIKEISKTFNPGTVNEKKALRSLSLTLADGDFVTVIGGNGAGKSTLLNAIAGTWFVDEGKILLDDKDVTGLPEYKRAKFLGRVFQDPMNGTAATMEIEENLALAFRRGDKRTLRIGITQAERKMYREVLARLGLGLENRMTSKVGLLSGGQRQALTLLMATLKKPKLLLLDEPTAALDAISENKMYETYSTLLKNKTALFISHRLASTRFCDTILFLENGKIKECGTHDELIALGGSYAHMFEVQSQYYQETEEDI